MHKSTTIDGQRHWLKQSRGHQTVASLSEANSGGPNIYQRSCDTNTENAAMAKGLQVLSEEEAQQRGYFSASLGKRYALEERTRYFNGLGFDVVIFDSRGLYWRIPHDPNNVTGRFEVACRITAAGTVTVNSKDSQETVQGILKERLMDKAINAGWRTLGSVQNIKVCDWEMIVHHGEFGTEDTLYMSELNLFITKTTNYIDAPYHPDAIAKIEGRSYGEGVTFGAFVNWNEGDRPQNYYVRICERTRTLPVVRNHHLPTGVYRFVRDGDRAVEPTLVKDSELGVTKYWHEIPIFRTAAEADEATSQNIIGQLELDAKEERQKQLRELSEKYDTDKQKLQKEKEDLETKLRLQTLDTAERKRETDFKIADIKERGAERNDARDDTSTWLKYIASIATIGLGLWKAFS